MSKEKYIEAGQIVNTHGIKGEVKITPWADNAAFLTGFETLYTDEKPLRVQAARVHGNFAVVKFEGVDDVNAAMCFKNKVVCIDRADVQLPEGRCFVSDLLGARVVSDAGEELGVLSDVMELPANNVYVVKGAREILIPAVPEFIRTVDTENGMVTVHLIEGM